MRYAQGGGLTAERREFRERLRLKAVERFARDETNAVIARELRVSVRSVQRWRRAWQQAGERALDSKGPASRPRLSPAQFRRLEAELARGPAAYGWAGDRWTLERIQAVIVRRFRVTYTVQGVRKLMRRHGWTYVAPAAGGEGRAAGGWTRREDPRGGRGRRGTRTG
ncbi:winged helix-turn-helix domain-containing protein [Streptomyces monomycini]|uniref:winged helix-turn-helix domain-containing protein n=1 Tax=Streptomyces monomycini TaxID=371720 RepID=UPI0004AB5249|nr:winged helix-turn-helix domain-containing protein [Streptomyces monomycini]